MLQDYTSLKKLKVLLNEVALFRYSDQLGGTGN